MKTKKAVDVTVLSAAVVGCLVLLNVLSVGLFGRLDLTRDRQFTLSAATRDTLKSLKDPVTIRAYFTKDLPPPYSTNARYVKDLLEEYYAAARGSVRFEFIDPLAEETEADKEKKKDVGRDIFGRAVREETSVEKELRTLGIPPVQVRVNEGDKLEVKRAYMGIAIKVGDKKEVIPVAQDLPGLEYDLTTMIRKVSREKQPKVALIGGHDNPEPGKGLQRFRGLLAQLYDVTSLDLTQKAEIPDDVTALVVIGPRTPLSEAEQRAIDRFVMSGRSAAFLLGAVAPDLKTMSANDIHHGLSAMLETYGVKVGEGLVLDADCASLNVQQQRGFMVISQPVKYPFVALPRALDAKHPLTRGLSEVAFPFMGPLTLAIPEGSGVKGEELVKSSARSWIQSPPYNLDPMQRWTADMIKEEGAKALVVTLVGPIKSAFAKPAGEAAMSSAAPAEKNQAENARVLVASGYAFVLDDFMSKGNEALALNLFDWLVQDEALLAVRARGLASAPIDDKISDTERNAKKYLNILGLPLAFVGLGLVRWRMREARRATVTL